MPKAASSTLSPLYKMRKELNSALVSSTKKALADLREHAEELELIASIDADTNLNKDYVNTIVEDAFEDAKKAIPAGLGLMKACSTYAHRTVGLLKRAQEVTDCLL